MSKVHTGVLVPSRHGLRPGIPGSIEITCNRCSAVVTGCGWDMSGTHMEIYGCDGWSVAYEAGEPDLCPGCAPAECVACFGEGRAPGNHWGTPFRAFATPCKHCGGSGFARTVKR